MQVSEAISKRFAERTYTDAPVTRDIIAHLLAAAHQAPCSCNLQLMQYVVVDDPELRLKLADIATKKLLWAPVNIFFFVDPRLNTERQATIMGMGAAMQNLALAATEMGLGTCPMAGFKGDNELKTLLGVPEYMEAILIMSVGYPKDSEQQKVRSRLAVEELVHYNQYSPAQPPLKMSDALSDWSIPELINYRRRIGPVYRYADRFRLHIFPDNVYECAAEIAKENVPHTGAKVLDLVSFDSRFAQAVVRNIPDVKLTVSDYFPEVTSIFAAQSDTVSYLEINEENELAADSESFELVTLVHKLNFTPNPAALVREGARVLKKDGLFLVTSEPYNFWKSAGYWLRKFWLCRIKGKSCNVYDNNPYYKIGPYKKRDLASLEKLCKNSGLRLVKRGAVELASTGRFKSEVAYALYAKD
ncbi:nitroreductase family protein [Candidatus Pacebacteria bacterium]|nr:nitroreductase family protein [Candidatus Paceibacterota bacterium]